MRIFTALTNSIGATFSAVETVAVRGEKLLNVKFDQSERLQKIEHAEELVSSTKRFQDSVSAEDMEQVATTLALVDTLFEFDKKPTKEA